MKNQLELKYYKVHYRDDNFAISIKVLPFVLSNDLLGAPVSSIFANNAPKTCSWVCGLSKFIIIFSVQNCLIICGSIFLLLFGKFPSIPLYLSKEKCRKL